VSRQQPGLLKTSLRFTWQGLNDVSLLRASILWPILAATLACVGLAAFGVTQQLEDPEAVGVYSPRLLGLLFLPAEFLIYDLVLGNPEPRLTFKRLWLDWRFARALWAGIRTGAVVVLPGAALIALLVGITTGFSKAARPSLPELLLLIAGIVAVSCAMFYFLSRFFYLSLAVARREPQPLRAAFRETKGRLWRICLALFLPFAAIFAAGIGMELLGPVLERRLGLAGLAPWFLLNACLTGYLSCLSAALLAFSYQRIILAGQAADQNPPPAQPPQPASTE
jgi:hypothetical protein